MLSCRPLEKPGGRSTRGSSNFAAAKFAIDGSGVNVGCGGLPIIAMIVDALSGYIIILGAEINAEHERQTKENTTVGPPGARGAYSADTVGPTTEEMKRS